MSSQTSEEPATVNLADTLAALHEQGFTDVTLDALVQLGDQHWRLNNLYSIIDDDGRVIQFRMKPVQERLYWNLWYRNIVLKARQHGFTTFLSIYALDSVLFNPNYRAGIIAHKLPAAQTIFRNKVDFAYKALPGWVKAIPGGIEKKSAEEIVFANGSSISVSTSFRSGTLQFLHVSEMGSIAAHHPERAIEIRTGAFEAVPTNGIIVVESTAEGAHGDFKELADLAQKAENQGRELTRLQWRMHFVPWYADPKYKLEPEEAELTVIGSRLIKYFDLLDKDWGIKLTPRQRAWYATKEAELGEYMWREYPSTPIEPFKVSLRGSYFSEQMRKARIDGRITKVPHTEGVPVDTWWDVGRDTTAIWFTQDIGLQVRVIRYFQDSSKQLPHYVEKVLEFAQEHRYRYGMHHFPHDMGVQDYSNMESKTRLQMAQAAGLLNSEALPRMKDKEVGIEAARGFIQHCLFDEEACDEGIAGLDAYRKEWDDKRGVWADKPYHDWASHPADAFQQLALYHRFGVVQDGRTLIEARPVVAKRFG